MTKDDNPFMDKFLANLQRRSKREAEWRMLRKPAHLLNLKTRKAFEALFDKSELSDINVRRCWWNGPPEFPMHCGILATWHPMVFEQIPGPVLNHQIQPLFAGFRIKAAYLWQAAETRWVYLSRRDPNTDDESTPYIETQYVQRVTCGAQGALSFETISAS